jgi:hypothetical protein
MSDFERDRMINMYFNHEQLVQNNLDYNNKYDLRFLDTTRRAPKSLTVAQLERQKRNEELKREKQSIRVQKKREQEERRQQKRDAKTQREAAKQANRLMKEQEKIDRQAQGERNKRNRNDSDTSRRKRNKAQYTKNTNVEQVPSEISSNTPWGEANLIPPDGLLKINDDDIPEALIETLQVHIDALKKPSNKTGFRTVYSPTGYDEGHYTVYLKGNNHRIALTDNLLAAVIISVAAQIDPRLLSQQSAAIWLLWMIEDPNNLGIWVSDETVQQNINRSSQMATRLKKKHKNVAGTSSLSANDELIDTELPIPHSSTSINELIDGEVPILSDEQTVRDMAVELAEFLNIGLSDAVQLLEEENFDKEKVVENFLLNDNGNS